MSTTIYNSLQSFAKFKADLHNIYTRAHKDPTKKWIEIHFVATDDVIFNVLETSLPEWHAPDITAIENFVAQRKKEEVKMRMAQLVEKRRKEAVTAEAQEARDAAQTTAEQEKAVAATTAQEAAAKVHEGQKLPSHGQEVEEEGGTDPQTVSTQLKRQHSTKLIGPQKKVKALKLSIDPITLTKGNLHDIGETVCNVTSEALQNLMHEN